MLRLARYSERFAPSGGIGAWTTHRALGPERLTFWELFLRETLQNSWDARTTHDGPIGFGVHAWTASQFQRSILRDVVLTDPPSGLGIADVLAQEPLSLLAVCDSGTWGLTGPTRADRDLSSAQGGRTDFVDLVRDTGRRPDKGYGGGTYGFGKAVLTRASAASTVVIYSRTAVSGIITSRLIAMAVGDNEYQESGLRYTGRHWWGLPAADIAEPVQGADAAAIASALGIQGLITSQTGTVILVIAPRTPGDGEPSGLGPIMSALADAAAEYAWPHMIKVPGRAPTIDFSFNLERESIPMRDPGADKRLSVFAEAYSRCEQLLSGAREEDSWPWHQRILRSLRPIRELGAFAWRHHGQIAVSDPDAEIRSEIALIRSPHFVVCYMTVPRSPSGQSTYGVFLADPSLDRDFAEAEPPAHDDWVATPGRHFDPARRVRNQIVEELRPHLTASSQRNGSEEPGTVAVASALGGLLDGGDDPSRPWHPQSSSSNPAGADDRKPVGGSSATANRNGRAADWPADGGHTNVPRSGRRPNARIDGPPRLLAIDGHRAVEFPFVVAVPAGCASVRVSANAEVLIDGGRETEPPAGAELPVLLQWRDLATGAIARASDLAVSTEGTSRWSVVISQPVDAAVSVSLTIGVVDGR